MDFWNFMGLVTGDLSLVSFPLVTFQMFHRRMGFQFRLYEAKRHFKFPKLVPVLSTVQYSTVQYSTVQYSTVQYCTGSCPHLQLAVSLAMSYAVSPDGEGTGRNDPKINFFF